MQPRTTALFMSRPASAPVPPLRLLGNKCPRTRSALEEPVCEKLIESRQHRIPRQVERLRKVASRRQSNTSPQLPRKNQLPQMQIQLPVQRIAGTPIDRERRNNSGRSLRHSLAEPEHQNSSGM